MRTSRPLARVLAAALAAVPAMGAPAAAAVAFEAPSGLAIVPATVDGRPVRLLLDTGDPGGLALDETAALRLGLEFAPGAPPAPADHGLLGASAGPRGRTRINRLAIDGMVLSGLDAGVLREPPALAGAIGATYDGVIGTALLAGLRVVIDYPGRRIAVAPGGAPDAVGPVPRSAPMRIQAGRFLTEADLGGGPRTVLIDTGSAATLVDPARAGIPRPGADQAGAEASAMRAMTGIVDAAGRSAGLPAVRLGRIAAGGAVLRDITALAIDLAGLLADGASPSPGLPVAILGADVLSRHRVTLDAVSGRFALDGDAP